MRIVVSTLLCLGLAACSHDRPAESAHEASESSGFDTASRDVDPSMTPASAEDAPARGRAATDAARTEPRAPRPSAADTDTSASNSDARDDRAAPRHVDADNTEVNERDRDDQNVTPPDQSNEQSDLRITQAIRKAVMADDSLSFTAKNVKIVTRGGRVALRGTVKTAAERASIESAARRVAGVSQVDNQIDVKQ